MGRKIFRPYGVMRAVQEEMNRVNLSSDSHNKLCESAEGFMKLLCLSNGHGEDVINL